MHADTVQMRISASTQTSINCTCVYVHIRGQSELTRPRYIAAATVECAVHVKCALPMRHTACACTSSSAFFFSAAAAAFLAAWSAAAAVVVV
eukprot:20314-Heterococcus_DN1.PRE.10